LDERVEKGFFQEPPKNQKSKGFRQVIVRYRQSLFESLRTYSKKHVFCLKKALFRASKTTSKIEKALKVSEPSSKMISRFETPSLKEERKNELLSA